LWICTLAGAGGAQHGAQYANHCGATTAGPAGTLLCHTVHGTGLLVILQLQSAAIKQHNTAQYKKKGDKVRYREEDEENQSVNMCSLGCLSVSCSYHHCCCLSVSLSVCRSICE